MKRKQYFALQIMFLVFMCVLIYMDSGNNFIYNSPDLSTFGIHTAVYDALMDMSIIISFFLSMVFMVLGFMEKKGK